MEDETGKPKLVIPKYDRVTASNPETPPGIVNDIFQHKSIGKGIRMYRNNLLFLVAFEDGVAAMYAAARRHLAMLKLAASDSMVNFADYQQSTIKKKKDASDADLDNAILKCHKYAYYPAAGNRLAYAMMDWGRGGGQRYLVGELCNKQKIRTSGDMPDNPESLVDRVAKLKTGGEITTLEFRNEFYKDTALPMLIGDEVFSAGIRSGIESGVFIYRKGDLICGKDDPHCEIAIDSDSVVYTIKRARKLGIWPRKPRDKEAAESDGAADGSSSENDAPKSPPAFDLSSVHATGKPSQAVRNVLVELRKHDISRISRMRIASKDDVFPLLSIIGRIKEIRAGLKMEGDYRTGAGGRLDIEFDGTLKDSEPVLEFLKPQLRNASVGNVNATLDIDFKDGIDIDLETLADRLRLVENDVTVSDIAGVSE